MGIHLWSFVSGLMFFMCFFSTTLAASGATEWQWYSGGSFSVACSPHFETVILGGEILVKGSLEGDQWRWHQIAPELTENLFLSDLDCSGSQIVALGVSGLYSESSEQRFLHSSSGASNWSSYPFPDWVFQISKVRIAGEMGAFAVGQDTAKEGILIQTLDGGKTWQEVFSSGPPGGNFFDFAVLSGQGMLVVGDYAGTGSGMYGVVVETGDNWQSHSVYSVASNEDLFALSAPTAQDAYVIGSDLAVYPVLLYRHGGAWKRAELPGDVKILYDVKASSPQHAWAVGRYEDSASSETGGVVLETTDGGVSWTRTNFCEHCGTQEVPHLNYLNFVQLAGTELFVGQTSRDGQYPCASNPLRCPGVVLAYEPVQDVWQRVEKVSGYNPALISINYSTIAKVTGLLAAYDTSQTRPVMRRLAQGEWGPPVVLDFPCSGDPPCQVTWTGLQSVKTVDAWTSGFSESTSSSSQMAYLFGSDDGGAGWTQLTTPQASFFPPTPPESFDTLAFGPFEIAGDGSWWGRVYQGGVAGLVSREDVASSWESIWGPEYTNLGIDVLGFEHFDSEHGCALGINSGVACTQDGGDSWVWPAYGSSSGSVSALTFLTQNQGWLSAWFGIFQTLDGGRNWNKISESPAWGHQIKFHDAKTGWLSGGDSRGGGNLAGLWRTLDGGVNWNPSTDGAVLLGKQVLEYLQAHHKGYVIFDIASNGEGWAVSPLSGMLLHRNPRTGILGDANGDGEVTVGDLMEVLLLILSGNSSETGGDCNDDGKTDVGDLVCINNKLLEGS